MTRSTIFADFIEQKADSIVAHFLCIMRERETVAKVLLRVLLFELEIFIYLHYD